MTQSFDDFLAAASLPEWSVALCLAGHLVAEGDRVTAELAAVGPATSLGDRRRADLQDQLVELQEQMRDATRTFRLRAMASKAWVRYYGGWPTRGEGEGSDAWQDRLWPVCIDLVSRICVDPVMTPGQVEQLAERLHSRAWNKLVSSCLGVNVGEVDVPNFVAGSGPTQDSEPA